eukprot:TCONS_00069036-protein
MKMKIRKPNKPSFVEKTSTPFQLIQIKANIRKCAGCGNSLKDGPDFDADMVDQIYCIRHKERDHFYQKEKGTWKSTFQNVHYHLHPQCITNRNPSFDKLELVMEVDLDGDLKITLTIRFY